MTVAKQEVDRRMGRFERACRAHGLRITHQRTEIYRELACKDNHPPAEAIHRRVRRRIPTMSLDTVYRTLATLERLGLARKMSPTGDRTRFDANADSHHHFVCTKCGMVRDVYSRDMDELELPEAARAMGKVTSRHVELRGVCARCSRRKAGRH
jgi:Fur family peroxide stress response transcriptional regulator